MREPTLRNFGWAPGGYSVHCCDCPKDLPFHDQGSGAKRSWRCEKHARERLAERLDFLERGYMPFNTNHHVLVKLNEQGIKILRDEHERLSSLFPAVGPFDLKLDEQGYYRCQLWSLMQTFGPHISLGRTGPFDTEILIPKDPK